ncbi:MAG: hypothetical protein ABW151_01240 [Pseudorhodoplanes sp.]
MSIRPDAEAAIPNLGSLVLIAERTMVDAVDALLGGWLGGASRARPQRQASAARVAAKADELIEDFRDRRLEIARDAKIAFHLLGAIPQTLRWNEGLKDGWSSLVLAAVQQSERFGTGTGAMKRKFATDLVVRVLERYNFGGLPFLTLQKTLLAPVVGILIDWTVEILNSRPSLWPEQRHVKLPMWKRGSYEGLLKLALLFSRFVMWINSWIRAPSRYERQLRHALVRIAPEANALTAVLPPTRLIVVIEEVADIVVRLGHLTAPYAGLVQQVLSLGTSFVGLDAEERMEAVFLMLRELLLDAYANDPLARIFIESPLGDYLLRAIVGHANWVLAENGLVSKA